MSLLSLALLGCFAFLVYRAWRSPVPRGASLPPGPKGVPFLGFIRNIPYESSWLTYTEWIKEYGDIIYIKTFGQPMIILGSLKAANELFDKRSSIYSDRPRMVRTMSSSILHNW